MFLLGQVCGAVVRTQPGMTVSHTRMPRIEPTLHCHFYLPVDTDPGEQQGMVQITGALPPTWETQDSFPSSQLPASACCKTVRQ